MSHFAKLSNPWPAGESIRSPWGYRKHPITGGRKKHRGVDVGYNGPIYAPADGKVVHKGVSLNKKTGGGHTLILSHSDPKVWTVYYHMREPSPLPLGKSVKRGDDYWAYGDNRVLPLGFTCILKLGAHAVSEPTLTLRASSATLVLNLSRLKKSQGLPRMAVWVGKRGVLFNACCRLKGFTGGTLTAYPASQLFLGYKNI
jgi:hypothetical protein